MGTVGSTVGRAVGGTVGVAAGVADEEREGGLTIEKRRAQSGPASGHSTMLKSTRRFCARPSSVPFSVIGFSPPEPTETSRVASMPFETR